MSKKPNEQDKFREQVNSQVKRKLKAQARGNKNIWFGFGMFGIIGWSIVLPTLFGTGLGMWLDDKYPSSHSWTLTLLVAGLIIGCWNAVYWVMKESKEMLKEEEKDD